MSSKYQLKKQKQKEMGIFVSNIKGSPGDQPFMRGKCASGSNVIQNRKASKRLAARIKDFGTIDWKRFKSTEGMHCPGSMQLN